MPFHEQIKRMESEIERAAESEKMCVFVFMNEFDIIFFFLLNELQQSNGNHFKLYIFNEIECLCFCFCSSRSCGWFFFSLGYMCWNPSLNGWRWMWISEYHRVKWNLFRYENVEPAAVINRLHFLLSFYFFPIRSKFRRFCKFLSHNWYSCAPFHAISSHFRFIP